MDPFSDVASSAATTLVAVLVVDAAVRLYKVSLRSSVAEDRIPPRVHRRAGREAFSLAVAATLGLVVVLWLV